MADTADRGERGGLELLGRKLGMTQIFTEEGERIPVTVLSVGPCTVVQKKTTDKEGYSALQLGFEDRSEKHTTAPMKGHFAKAGVAPQRFVFECRVNPSQAEGLEPGQQVDCVRAFEGVAKVDVVGVSKGRGFSGVIKRWNFRMPKQTHGTHEFFRHGGSVGAGSHPGKIDKGKRMAGQHGNTRVTQLGLRVEKIDPEKGLMYVRGAVPGATEGLIRVRTSTRV